MAQIDNSRIFDIGTSRATLNELKATWLKAKKADTLPNDVTFSKAFQRNKWSFYRPDSKAPLLSQVIKLDGVFVPVGSLITNWLAKQRENPGIAVLVDLESELSQAWQDMIDKIKNGELPAIATQEYYQRVNELYDEYYNAAWDAGRQAVQDDIEQEQEDNQAGVIIGAAIALGLFYLSRFLSELNGELGSQADTQAMADLLARRRARAIMHAGGVWTLYNQAKIIGFPPDSVWRWSGPIDSRSCTVCVQEVNAGARRLSEITRLPGRDTLCVTHCRHELTQVKKR